MGAGKTKAQLDAILKPLVADLVATGIPFLYNSYEYPTFLSGWKALFDSKPSGVPIAMSSRLVSRAHFASNTTELVATIRNIHDNDADWVGHFFAPGKNGVLAETSVNPVWKESIFLPLWVYQVPDTSENGWAKVIDIMNNVDGPSMKELTPGSGAYVNEVCSRSDGFWKVY